MSIDAPTCLQRPFERRAAARPHAVALEQEGVTVSYGSLDAAANRLAQRLRLLGVGPEARVAIAASRGVPLVIAILAVLKAGGAYVPLDPDAPAARNRAIVADCTPAAVLADTAAREALDLPAGAPVLDLERDAPGWAGLPPEAPQDTGLAQRNAAYVIYTSGSNGRPKGVVVEHAQATALLAALVGQLALNASDTWAQFHSVAFDFSAWELFGALTTGARAVIVPLQVARAGDALYQLVCERGVTVLNQTPGALRQLLAAQAAAPAPHRLRYLLVGGERVDPRLAALWAGRHAGGATAFAEVYGTTESTVFATTRVDAPGAPAGSGIGRPIAGWRVYLLDAALEPVPPGTPGELWIGGAGVARGYHGQPKLTAERFLPDPFSGAPGARMYHSGDLARVDTGGGLDYLGRCRAQVKVRGFRVEPGEIEVQLCGHPGVQDAVVLAQAEGEGDARLIAYFTARADDAPSPMHLRTYLARRLPEYMLPVAYVRREAFALTLNGKIDRECLPVPAPSDHPARTHAPPEDELERWLATMWEELLGVRPVGRDDNFFELGGHSLRAAELVMRVGEALSTQLPLGALFDAPVLRDFAVQVREARDNN